MMIIGAVFVLVYTILGGFLAESASDFMQAIVMIIALTVVVIIGTVKAGGIGDLAANPVRNRIVFDKPVKARYFKFNATHSLSGNNQCCFAEIDIW